MQKQDADCGIPETEHRPWHCRHETEEHDRLDRADAAGRKEVEQAIAQERNSQQVKRGCDGQAMGNPE